MLSIVYRKYRKFALEAALVVYIFLCISLGGAGREGLFLHGLLQSSAAIGIAFLVITWPRSVSLVGVKWPICILGAWLLIGGLQCIPIPSWMWTALPGRERVVDGFNALGVPLAPMPLSLDYEATLQILPSVLPPFFVLLLCVRLGIRRLKRIVPGLLFFIAITLVLLGLLQVYAGGESALYFYDNTNPGFPVGTFANVNHFASILLMIMPFVIRELCETSFRLSDLDEAIAWVAIVMCALLFVVVGIGAAGTLSIYLMTLPIVGFAWFSARQRVRFRRTSWGLRAAVVTIAIVGIVAVSTSPVLDGLGVTGSAENPTSRQNMWAYTLQASREFWPFGSGLGTYQSVIPSFEDPDLVTSRYIATAHNEYLQFVMEMGFAGVITIFAALGWFLSRAKAIWLVNEDDSLNKMRKMAVITILVFSLHSVVDYPARTPAIAALLAVFVALIALPKHDRVNNENMSAENKLKRVVL